METAMLIRDSQNELEALQADWPKHYFEIEDIEKRQRILEQRIAKDPEARDDQERLKLLHKRFQIKTGAAWADRFMHGWLMIRVLREQKVNRFNQRKLKHYLQTELIKLCVLEYPCSEVLKAEWKDFAYRYILSCADSRNYRTAILGFVPMKDETIAWKILREIDDLTRVIPAQFGYEKECEPLRAIMLETYTGMIDHGEEYAAQLMKELEK